MTASLRQRDSQSELAAVRSVRRVRNLAALYGRGYRWNGRCPCGGDDWEHTYWHQGYCCQCQRCGWWCCYHEVGSVAHTSDGLWAPYPNNRRSRPPSNCPTLSERPEMAPEGV
jgi:hypothetical protein